MDISERERELLIEAMEYRLKRQHWNTAAKELLDRLRRLPYRHA